MADSERTVDQEDLDLEIRKLRAQIAELEANKRELEERLSTTTTAAEVGPPITTTTELEATLRTFVKKVAMILQAEKCVIMLFDPETGELVAQKPALGLNDEEVQVFRVRASQGISGQAFRDGQPVIADDAIADPRTVKENVALLNVRNALCVPMIIEHRNEEQQVVEKRTIGVIDVFNKRYGATFSEEDVRLLTVLARSAAAVISNAQLYMEVTAEKKQLEYTLQSLLSGVLMVGKNGQVLLMNSAAKKIFNIPGDNGTGKPLHEVIDREDIQKLVSTSLETMEEKADELTLYAPTERIFQVQTALVRDESLEVMGVVAIFNDVTELRNVERMKTEFVSNVSHELRTPLTSIKGFVRTLLDDKEEFYDRETQYEFYTIIDTECDRLVRLISDLLNVSRIESGRALELNWKKVDLPELIKRAVTIQRSYASGHEFQVKFPDEFPTIVADEDKIDQVIANLLSNAVKYSSGGSITIQGEDRGDQVAFGVTDQGIGIPPDQMDKIFTRFHRVEEGKVPSGTSATGAGIGLYLVKHLVDAHHGKIDVESEVEKGSTFTVTLPKNPPGATVEEPAE